MSASILVLAFVLIRETPALNKTQTMVNSINRTIRTFPAVDITPLRAPSRQISILAQFNLIYLPLSPAAKRWVRLRRGLHQV